MANIAATRALLASLALSTAACSAPQASPQSSVPSQDPAAAPTNEVRASNARWSSGRLLVDVCFDLPNALDWTLYEPSVSQDGHEFRWSETSPISLTRLTSGGGFQTILFAPDGSQTIATEPAGLLSIGTRCDTVAFDGPSANATAPMLHVPAIIAEPREGQQCSAANLERLQVLMASKFPGVEVGCAPPGPRAPFTFNNLPNAVSLAEVEAYAASPDFLVDLHGVTGPWDFQLAPN